MGAILSLIWACLASLFRASCISRGSLTDALVSSRSLHGFLCLNSFFSTYCNPAICCGGESVRWLSDDAHQQLKVSIKERTCDRLSFHSCPSLPRKFRTTRAFSWSYLRTMHLTGRIGSAFVVIHGIRNALVAENWKLQARRSHLKGDDSAR